jgi:Tol biopolymer transport system component
LVDRRDTLIDIATAIADGTPIDWHSVESDTSDRIENVTSGLRLVEQIAFVHSHATPAPVQTAEFPSEDLLRWGPLTIVEKIGSGTFGDVYRARDPRLDRPVALKLLRQTERASSHPPSAVIEEARLMARVRHPNVVTVHGAERIEDRVGIWMELIDGPTLETELRQKGPFATTEIVQLGLDLCAALEAVHGAGLLHGDVKASNIIRDANGRVVLGDFGAGHEFDPTHAVENAATPMAGTPLYLAPEILEGGRPSVRSDIYSLGVAFYHLATGSFPVQGRTLRELRDAHERNVRVPLSALRRDLPRPLIDLVERCIDPDSNRRFVTAADVQTRLQHVADRRTAQRALRNWIAAAACVAAVATGAFFALGRFADTPMPVSSEVTVPQVRPQPAPSIQPPGPALGAELATAVADTPSPPSRGMTLRQQILPQWKRTIGLLGPPLGIGATTCIDRETANLAVCDLRTGDVKLLTSDGSLKPLRRVVDIAVGPDDRLAFTWSEEAPGKSPFGSQEIREIRRDGSGQRTVFQPEADARFVRLLQWIPARDALLVAVANAAGVQRAGMVPLDGSAPTWVKEFDQVAPEYLSLSADGQYLAFDVVPQPGNPARDIHVLDLATRREWPLVEHPASDLTPIWAPDSRTLVFSSDRLGTMGLWTVATTNGYASGEPKLVRDIGRSVPRPRGFTAAAGLLYGAQVGWFDVYTAPIDLERGTVGQPVRISPRPLDQNLAADWSFDGDRIAYVSGPLMFNQTSGAIHIVVKERSTNTERLLPHPGAQQQTRLRWSPDASQLLKLWRTGVEIVSAESGETIRQLKLAPGSDGIEWSHAGDRIYSIAGNRILSTSLNSSVTTELHRVPPPDALDGVLGLAISPDDRWLTFTTLDSKRRCTIHIMPTDGGPPMERVRLDEVCSDAAWSPDGRRLVFSVGANGTLIGPTTLWTVDTAAGDPRRLALAMDRIFQIRLHPNGREILFTSGAPRTEYWLLEGFLENQR